MKYLLPLLLAGCAVKAGTAHTECTFATDATKAEFCAQARDLGATTERHKDELRIRLNGEPGASSSFAKGFMAREASCCPHLKMRLDQEGDVNILHVSADKEPEALDRIHRLLQQK